MNRYMTDEQRLVWAKIAAHIREATRELDLAYLLAATEGEANEKAFAAITEASNAINGLAYMCTPQSEWQGGDYSKTRWPHVFGIK